MVGVGSTPAPVISHPSRVSIRKLFFRDPLPEHRELKDRAKVFSDEFCWKDEERVPNDYAIPWIFVVTNRPSVTGDF